MGGNPPEYQASPLLNDADRIPDDFKYSVDVASCELPIRQMYIRKVYALLSVQILATVIVGFILRSNSSIQRWAFDNMWLFFVSLVGGFGFLIATAFKARSYPVNLVLLSCFTVCEAYGIGLCAAMVKTEIVVQALLLTFVIFMGLTLFAFQTKYDFTSWQGYMIFALWSLIGWGFLMMFFPGTSSLAEQIYSGLGALVFSIYIIIDTQIILKKAHLEDEILSTMMLYMDILNLFLYLMRFLQLRDD